ncbi:hypothetical protein FKW77_008857 [Venturia effusa]|uniref:5'-Nucleotidase C-terminal domain-containing protein n=1 Tax=Venturia effusa TaxID=50376 RepID=A0A517LBH4_9PEZI|nr:hypothetical protein FKW77_008857 [Venturia effusa]
MNIEKPTPEEVLVYGKDEPRSPDLRLMHYNDVYHVDPSSAEPAGGVARFMTICRHYQQDLKFEGQPKLLTFFSGDAFNPSLESSVTKGSHMVPVLNAIGTNVACVGNHDLDFGVRQFRHLTSQCHFPWLLANVLDPALGENIPLGNAGRTTMLTSSNGIKIGVIGLAEREWLDTINSLPPNLIYKSASATAKELVPGLREQGAEIVIALTHQREPNDNKLAESIPDGLIDLILGGHDHYYGHSFLNGTHVLRSGTDFKNLSYIEAWRKSDGSKKWDFKIIRRDMVSSIPEDPGTAELVSKLTESMKARLEKPIGYTAAPLDARFTTVRLKESNIGNFVCDLMRAYHQGDCCIMAAGTIRGDQIYPPGVIKMKDILNCFPFEDPVVVIKATGQAIYEALENSVSSYPALEGRFPQVSNINFTFDPSLPQNSRIDIKTVEIGAAPLDAERIYTLVTRGYMGRGKDGYTSLLVEPEGGKCPEVVSEENGVLISTIMRQYFMSLKVLGKWKLSGPAFSKHWDTVQQDLHQKQGVLEPEPLKHKDVKNVRKKHMRGSLTPTASDSEDDDGAALRVGAVQQEALEEDRKADIIRRVMKKWWRLAGLQHRPGLADTEEFNTVHWTRAIAPRLEGRINMVGG